MKTIQILIVLLLCFASCDNPVSETEDIKAIRNVMNLQQQAWSNNDLEGFMEGYLKSDSITYFGSNGIRRGHKAMLDSYKERYPTKAHTGTLKFTLHDIARIENYSYWVMGEYHLTREMGNANGTFMVIFKRIDGEWKIVSKIFYRDNHN